MNFKEQLDNIRKGLLALDTRKKMILAGSLLIGMTAVIFFSAQFSKPVTAPLYSNLSREDLNSMSRILSENGIEFVTNSDNGSVEVRPQVTAQARMLLAEHGLPSSQESGYELFDRVNTLGLTSFMQDVTNKRAIEGELVRTIQMINGVNSARVHLVMEDKNVFRRGSNRPPSASVVLKTFGKIPSKSVSAVRHMVAAAVPGLEPTNVTIVGADGTLMISRDNGVGGTNGLVDLEKEYEQDTENKILAALGAHLGIENLRVSVTAKLNSDKRRVDETTFDPDSKVERSVQVVKEAGTTENKESSRATTIDQNIPEEETSAGSGQSSLENSERREELTNYEINQRKTSVVSDGYSVERLSIALVVNKSRLAELIGGAPQTADLEVKSAELENIVKSAVSVDEGRGDQVTVNLVEFISTEELGGASQSNAISNFVAMHLGNLLNAIGLIVASVLFAMLGIRPLISFLSNTGQPSEQTAALPGGGAGTQGELNALPADGADDAFTPIGQLTEGNPQSRPNNSGTRPTQNWEFEFGEAENQENQLKEQLGRMVSQSEKRAALVIKNWLHEDQVKGAKA